MSSKPSSTLSSTNPYLRDPEVGQRTLLQSVATSTAIEGVHAPFKQPAKAATAHTVSNSPAVRKKP